MKQNIIKFYLKKSKNKSIKIRYFTTEKLWSNDNDSVENKYSTSHYSDNFYELDEIKTNGMDSKQEENESFHSQIFPVSSNQSIVKLFEVLGEYMSTKGDFLTSSSTGLSKSKNNVFLIQAEWDIGKILIKS